MTATIDAAIGPRENGKPPPEVPLADIDLAQIEFWGLDGDYRDGAFATLRREAPIKFFEVPEFGGFPPAPVTGRCPVTTTCSSSAVIRTCSVPVRPAPR